MTSTQNEGESWKIGILFSQTGVTAVAERPQLNATLLAIEQVNAAGGAGGRFLKPVIYDPKSDPKVFRHLAEQLLRDDGVSIVAGCYMSSTRKAILPVVERYQGLLLYPTLYEGFEYSDHSIITGAAPNQNVCQLTAYLMENHGTRFYLVGSNYVFPYETNRVVSDLVHEARGDVIEERYIPLNATTDNCEQIVADIKKKQPSVVFSTIVGTTTARFYKAYRAAGLDPAKMPIASLTTSESEVGEMGSEAAEGHITAAPYFQSIDTPENAAFLNSYRAMFGDDVPVTSGAEAAFFQIHFIAQALERGGTDRHDALLEEVRKCYYRAPQGDVRVDPDNNHTYLWPRVARVNSSGVFEILRESPTSIKPDPYLVSLGVEEWRLPFASR